MLGNAKKQNTEKQPDQNENTQQKTTEAAAGVKRQLWREALLKLHSEQVALIKKMIEQGKELDLWKPYEDNVDTATKFAAFAELALFNASVSEQIHALEAWYGNLLADVEKDNFLLTPEEGSFLSEVKKRFDTLQTKQKLIVSITQMIGAIACVGKYKGLTKTIDSDYAKLKVLAARDKLDDSVAQGIEEGLAILDRLNDVVKGLSAVDSEQSFPSKKQQAIEWREIFGKQLSILLEKYHGSLKLLAEKHLFLIKGIADGMLSLTDTEKLKDEKEWLRQVEALHKLESSAERLGLSVKGLAAESAGWLDRCPMAARVGFGQSGQHQSFGFSTFTAGTQQMVPFAPTQTMGNLNLNQPNQNSINLNSIDGVNEMEDEENVNTIRFSNQ